ncbi:MAG TPA: peptidylprolyl isomerase, partial [Nitrosomonas halophila]|nr:peptidylprolyl isomerase [Nitrosomonas halophila]
ARTSDPHSASSQFFINVANNNFLDYTAPTLRGYGYTVFGKVTAGMDVVNRIAATPTGAKGPFASDVPQDMVIIEHIKPLAAPARAQ